MKILQLAGLAGPASVSGGVWRVASIQSSVLKSMGHEVTLVSGWWGALPQGTDASGADVLLRAREPLPRSGLRSLWIPTLTNQLGEISDRIEVAHVHLARDFITTPSVFRLHRDGVPVVAQPHGMLSTSGRGARWFDLAVRRRVLRSVTLWLALTDQEVDDLERYGVAPEQIRRIENAVPRGPSAWRAPKIPTFSFVSRLHPRKQVLVLVKAAQTLFDRGFDFRVIVAGPDEGDAFKLKRAIDESGYRERFTVMGSIGKEEVTTVLSSSVLVLPSIGEIAPMVAIEAAAVGAPIILTQDSGLSGVFEDERAAEIIAPDSFSLAAAMEKLLGSGAEMARMGRAAQKLHESRWSEESLGERLNVIYAEAAESS